jgi:hemoglobin/transferrin/lactoferrin receptor protein
MVLIMIMRISLSLIFNTRIPAETAQKRSREHRARQEWRLGAALLALATALAQPVWSQESRNGEETGAPAAPAPALLPGVTVTATKTERALEDVPESVTVVDGEQLQQEQAASLDDALKSVPNVEMGGGPRRIREQPFIRGLGGGRVVVQIDGARQNFESGHQGSLFVEPELLKRVEVLRGPASALYGSDALGGVLSLNTKDPADFLLPGQRHGAQLRGGYQSAAQERMASPALYGRIGEDWSYLLYGTRRLSSDLRAGGGDVLAHSADDITSWLAKLMWTPSSGAAVRLSLSEFVDVQQIPKVGEADDPSATTLVDRTTRAHIARAAYASEGPPAGLWHPSLNLYVSRIEIRERGINSGGVDKIEWTTNGLELRNSSFIAAGGIEHTLTYGLEQYNDEERASRDGEALLVFPNATARRTGVYLQHELVFGSWRVTPGLRYDVFFTEAEAVKGANENRHLSPKLGAVYTVTHRLNVHALYAEGFRAPGIQELYISGLHFGGSPTGIFVPNPGLQPEQSANKEVGFTYTHRGGTGLDGRLQVRAAAFQNSVSEFIDFAVYPVAFGQSDSGVTCGNGGGCLFFKPINVRRARITGGEIETGYEGHAWRASLAFSQVRGEDLDAGQPLDSMPADKLVTVLQHALRGDWWLGARRTDVATQGRVSDPSLETPGYVLHDVFTTYEPRGGPLYGLRVDAGVDNIGDVTYRRHLSPLKEAGRNYKVAVTYRFGGEAAVGR